MNNHKTIASFGRRGPAHHGMARYLGDAAPPAAPPAGPAASPPDACSVTAWYEDPPLDKTTGKPTGGMKNSTMAYFVMGVPAVAGAVLGGTLFKSHRVVGAIAGLVGGFAAGAGVDTYQYNQWKAAGGSKHVKGACDAPGTASAEPVIGDEHAGQAQASGSTQEGS